MLRKIKQFTNILKGNTPKQLIVQLTDKCNASCPQCSMRASSNIVRTEFSKEKIDKIISQAEKNDVQFISFTGGEPFLKRDLLIDAIFTASNMNIPYIRTGTNGYIFTDKNESKIRELAVKLSSTKLYNLWISLDTYKDELHDKMRGIKDCTKGIKRALPILKEYGIFPSANLGINRNIAASIDHLADDTTESKKNFFDSYFNGFIKFFQHAADLGFTIASVCFPMGEEEYAVYGAASSDRIVNFTNEEKVLIFKALYEALELSRGKIRIFTPKSSLLELINQYENNKTRYKCLGGKDYFFISSAKEKVYPCGYRDGEEIGDYDNFSLSKKSEPNCVKCDWECFRDPSTIWGPILDLKRKPFSFLYSFNKNYNFYKVWLNDIIYFRACEFFNGRKDINFDKINRLYPNVPHFERNSKFNNTVLTNQ